jgi:hypothetical protein
MKHMSNPLVNNLLMPNNSLSSFMRIYIFSSMMITVISRRRETI